MPTRAGKADEEAIVGPVQWKRPAERDGRKAIEAAGMSVPVVAGDPSPLGRRGCRGKGSRVPQSMFGGKAPRPEPSTMAPGRL